jgi:cell wall-associated NlpC family hydrolase
MGERVSVYETNDEGWAWGQLDGDGYVGFMPTSGLGAPGPAPTHRVSALRTLVFPAPSFKLPPIGALPLGARVAVVRTEGRFAVTASGGYLPAQHLAPVDSREPDFVAIAERFLGTPYLWGGKTSLGLDCSGLVQVALAACGIACPRDTDMQMAALGTAVTEDTRRRGDLIFWKGHVAIVRDETTVVHANAFHMAVAIEPIDQAIARIRSSDGDVTSVRRVG